MYRRILLLSDRYNSFVIASDHAGYDLKQQIKSYLEKHNYTIKDLGPFNTDSVDYPDYGKALGDFIVSNKNFIGIAVCGSGIGISIAANKVKGIRAALCTTPAHAEMSRKHNDANVLALGARMTDYDTILEIVNTWLNTEFDGGRHLERINLIEI